MAILRREHLREIRLLDLEKEVRRFDVQKKHATPSEIAAFANLEEAARSAIERDSADFDTLLEEMSGRTSAVLWRQDDVVKLNFIAQIARPDQFTDRAAFDRLRAEGLAYMENNNYDGLRRTLSGLLRIRIPSQRSEGMFDDVNIVRS